LYQLAHARHIKMGYRSCHIGQGAPDTSVTGFFASLFKGTCNAPIKKKNKPSNTPTLSYIIENRQTPYKNIQGYTTHVHRVENTYNDIIQIANDLIKIVPQMRQCHNQVIKFS
jgi:hypothetical protein